MRTTYVMALLALFTCSLGRAESPLFITGNRDATGPPWLQVRQVVAASEKVLASRDPESAVDLRFVIHDMADAVKWAPQYEPARRVWGRALLEGGRYQEAATAFRRALILNPKDGQAAFGMREARWLRQVARGLGIPKGLRIYRLAEVPRTGRPGVFVVVGKPFEEESIDGPRVEYFIRQAGRYRKVMDKPAYLGTEKRGDDFEFARIWVRDLQRTGRPQILLISGWIGADCLPTFIDIWEPEGKGLRQVLHVDSDEGATLVNRGGRREIKVTHLVGATAPHTGMSFWSDVYRYDGKRYVRANNRHPRFSRDQLASMQQMNRDYPNDWDVLEHLALAHRDLGQPKKAAVYEARAKKAKANPPKDR